MTWCSWMFPARGRALVFGLSVAVCMGASVCASICAIAQPSEPTTPAPYVPPATETRVAADSARTAPATPIPTPLLQAGFALSSQLVDLQALHLLRACQAMFEHDIQVGTVNAEAHAAAGRAGSPPAPPPPEPVFVPLPDSAIMAGRQCLARIGDTKGFQPEELPFVLQYAVGINDDTLVQNIVARQLAIAGANVRNRGRVLEAAIGVLLHNQWNGQGLAHRTPAHDTLALHYSAQIDTMQPVAQVLATRLRLRGVLQEFTRVPGHTLEDTLNAGIASLQADRQLAMSVPLRIIPKEDTAEVRGEIKNSRVIIARLTFFKTPTHANLAEKIAVWDSVANIPKGETMDSLINLPAPRLEGDWWFQGTADLASPPVLPTPGTTSVWAFADSLDPETVDRLQHLHTQFPELQIVLVSMTHGGNNNIAVTREQLHAEAAGIAKRFTDVLQFAPLVCVLEMKYHTDADASGIPLASPILDRFHIDPRDYTGKMYLIDAQGWIIEDWPRVITNGQLLRRLLGR